MSHFSNQLMVKALLITMLLFLGRGMLQSQLRVSSASEDPFQTVTTFVNPVLPGDHPDLTLFKKGDDFYCSGSNFHFTPYLPVLHSTDLVHWQEICRVVPPTWSGLISDAPQAGTWGGAITWFYGSWWIYFSNTAGGGQYFCKAANPAGPWSVPVKVKTTATTGAIGYDNSVFVDDDGTPYMHIKNGQFVNRIQRIGQDGHLTGEALNLDWVNADGRYSWAEGPVMCKREGWYYYFIAGNVAGGQYVLRSRNLTANPQSWEALGNFFANVTDPAVTFRSPNHIAQPFMLEDSTWWTISHSYEALGTNAWNGQGRQGLLHQVVWDDKGKPTGMAPTTTPQAKPRLPRSGIPWKLPRSDYFDSSILALSWHFLSKQAATKASLTEKPGWLTLNPGTGTSHILHKEANHYSALVTRIDFDATENGQQAGIYLTNGNESVTALLYTGYNEGKKIGFRFNDKKTEVDNPLGNILWLKVERYEHQFRGYYGPDGITWTRIVSSVSAIDLDKTQPDYNWWVGTSNGLHARGAKARFDLYIFKDGFSALPTVGYNNYYGLETKVSVSDRAMTNSTGNGGWLMLGGVDLGQGQRVATHVEVDVAAIAGGTLEVWMDDLGSGGTKIAAIAIEPTGGETLWKKFREEVTGLSGQHDMYLRWNGPAKAFQVKSLQYIPDESYFTGIPSKPLDHGLKMYPNPVKSVLKVESREPFNALAIFNIHGQKILEQRFDGNEYSANLPVNFGRGVYFLQAITGSQPVVEKFIVGE